MQQALFLECNAGLSGDMAVAALLDAGASEAVLRKVLDSLPAQGFSIEITRVNKQGIDACDFNVVLDVHHENHDHDMDYLYGHLHESEMYACGHEHGCDHSHNHEHPHEHPHEHSHEHRNLASVTEIIQASCASENAQACALRIFSILAAAEAKAHGTSIDEVHFHEIGAIDSIVDILAFSVCLDNLGIGDVIVPYVCEGRGSVRCQHGILPVPVPAVCNIVVEHNIALKQLPVDGELLTPTGAAIVAATRTKDTLPSTYCIRKIGMGAGKRNYPNTSGLVRAVIVEYNE